MDEKRRVLSIDLETFSDIDLSSCGVYRYVEGDFHILLFAYAFDDEDVRVVDMACGEELPQEVRDAIFDETVIKAAWNAQFERTCLSRYFGTQLSPDSWQCSMVWAASLSLPLKLKTAAEVLKTGEQKDDAGERLIKYCDSQHEEVGCWCRYDVCRRTADAGSPGTAGGKTADGSRGTGC